MCLTRYIIIICWRMFLFFINSGIILACSAYGQRGNFDLSFENRKRRYCYHSNVIHTYKRKNMLIIISKLYDKQFHISIHLRVTINYEHQFHLYDVDTGRIDFWILLFKTRPLELDGWFCNDTLRLIIFQGTLWMHCINRACNQR